MLFVFPTSTGRLSDQAVGAETSRKHYATSYMKLTGKPVRAGVVFDKINRMTPANAIGFHNLPTARHCSGVCHLINEITPMQTTTGVFITPGWDNNITKTGTSYRRNGSRTITENRNGFFDTKVVV